MTQKSGQAALDKADTFHTYSPGYCLKWVRTCWDVGSFYASAIDAWNGAYKKHPGDRNPPTGAPCFYRGGTYGHIVVYRLHNNGNMRSTDCQSTGNVNNDDLGWPERNWGQDYLGWTEDLNGVDLPLGSEDDVLNSDDKTWIKNQIAASQDAVIKRVNELMGDVVPNPKPDNDENTVMAKTALGMLLDRTD